MVNMSVWMELSSEATDAAWRDVRVAIGCPTKLPSGAALAYPLHVCAACMMLCFEYLLRLVGQCMSSRSRHCVSRRFCKMVLEVKGDQVFDLKSLEVHVNVRQLVGPPLQIAPPPPPPPPRLTPIIYSGSLTPTPSV